MPSLFYLPKVVSLPGAKLYFSQTGTTTPQNVYTDADLSVAHSSPVTADANGVFAPIYLDPTLPDYRVRLETSTSVLVYQVDDVPSNQNVQQSMRLESTNPFLFLYDTDGTSGSRKYRVRAAGAAFEVQASNDAENTFTTILQYTGGVLYSNATEVAVTSSGSFTGTLTGMTGTVTGTIYYRKINNLVTMWSEAEIAGTSNSTALTMTGIPSALQTVNFQSAFCTLKDNGNSSMLGRAGIFGSLITFQIAKSNAVANYIQCDSNGFTNSGSKGLVSGWSVSYVVA